MMIGKRRESTAGLRKSWIVALALFLLAGSTGSLMRFGMISGLPAGLQLQNVRHAHSHLMYFGWVTPALMALIAARLPALSQRARPAPFYRVLKVTLLIATLSYLPFLLFGYRSAALGGLSLPLSMIGAALNIFAWYAFVAVYWRATRGVPRHLPLRLWDAALVFLVLASLGAWMLAAAALIGIQHPFWTNFTTHLFLDLFADGWFVLALLGLAYAALPEAAGKRTARWGETLLVSGLPVTFLLSLPADQLPAGVRLIAAAGGVLVALGLSANLAALLPIVWQRRARGSSWLLPLFFLGLKAMAELGISIPSVAQWSERVGLRISYLHWLLLGFVTLGLFTAAVDSWGERAVPGRRWFAATVLLLLLSLIPLTHLWPTAWGGWWTLKAAAWASLGPLVVAAAMLAAVFWQQRWEQEIVRRATTTETIQLP